MSDENQNDSEVEESSPDEPEKEFKEISELSDKEIQAERKVIISRLLEIQKKIHGARKRERSDRKRYPS